MKFNSVNEAIIGLTKLVLSEGAETAPRGKPTLELEGVHLVLDNPIDRITTLPERKFSLPLAIGELCWHFRGDDDVDALSYYARAWRSFTDDGSTISGSCYGRKLMGIGGDGPSPWARLVSLLKSDPSTRRATFSFITNDEDIEKSKDVSCVSSIQFLIRNGRLNMFTFMRSNDLFLGLPYDIFLFSTIMELMALDVGVDLGDYHHFATSLHLYETNFAASQRLLKSRGYPSGVSPALTSRKALETLSAIEEKVRNGEDHTQYDGPFEKYVTSLMDFQHHKQI